jgi:hypothetical protein
MHLLNLPRVLRVRGCTSAGGTKIRGCWLLRVVRAGSAAAAMLLSLSMHEPAKWNLSSCCSSCRHSWIFQQCCSQRCCCCCWTLLALLLCAHLAGWVRSPSRRSAQCGAAPAQVQSRVQASTCQVPCPAGHTSTCCLGGSPPCCRSCRGGPSAAGRPAAAACGCRCWACQRVVPAQHGSARRQAGHRQSWSSLRLQESRCHIRCTRQQLLLPLLLALTVRVALVPRKLARRVLVVLGQGSTQLIYQLHPATIKHLLHVPSCWQLLSRLLA